ncbi:MAG: DUF5126 domain-containing protein [Proteiniphilum sp.]|jgi:hypothetical protein|nr:DUF5126 domain-containing protein [Proteiniphilum sp.]
MKQINFNKRKYSFGIWTAGSLLFLLSLAILSCSELPTGQTPTDSEPPSPLSNVSVTPTHGGAHITYSLPVEDDISYVKCEFTYAGVSRTARSSIYKNYMELDGIGEPEEIELRLYVVDHSENLSEVHIERFTPLDPPMTAVYNSFEIVPTYGGVVVTWKNPAEAMVGISFMASNDYGELELRDMVFSSLPEDSKKLRPFNTRTRLFALSITDKYENTSDTFRIEVKPFYEVMLDKDKFSTPELAGDNTSVNDNRPIQKIWDGVLDDPDKYHGWHTDAAAGYTIPQYFTINLGTTAHLTHITIFERGEIYPFAQHNLRLFDIYGWPDEELPRERTDAAYYDNATEWTKDWTLLAACEVIKPSGMPPGTNTPEDLAAHNAGFDYDLRQDVAPMRYIRFVVHDTWAHTPAMHMAELSVYGDDGNETETDKSLEDEKN